MPYHEFIAKAAVLIEALPYIQLFRHAVVVIKFGGSAMEDPDCTDSALRDIVFMECIGMKPVVVHGGGKAISAKLREKGIETRFISGLRYTCERSIEVVDDVLHNQVNPLLVQTIQQHGGRAQSLSGKKILTATPAKAPDAQGQETVDLGFVGEVAAVDIEGIQQLLQSGVVPVIPPLGVDKNGQTYNINADVAACRIAEELKARKLVFLSDVPGLLRDPQNEDTLISSVKMTEVDELIQSGVISGGMKPKLLSAVRALQAGTNKVHLIDGRIRHSLLLEIFTDQGIGTQIIKD